MVEHLVSNTGGTIDSTDLAQYHLRLHKPWSSAKALRSTRQGWLVRLRSGKHCGYGDCAPLPEMGTENLQEAETQLRAGLRSFVGLDTYTALSRLNRLQHTPAARCALEMAIVDLLSQHANLPLARWLNCRTRARVAVNTALGGIDDDLQSRVRMALEQGFSVLKIKLGLQPLGAELQALQAVCTAFPQQLMLRLDANGAWDEPAARHALHTLRDHPVEGLEEPLASPRPVDLRRLQDLVSWPLAVDESLRRWPLVNLLERPPVRRIVLKPMVLGGVLPALRIARRALTVGLQCVVTTTVDSAAGVWAALHLAAAINNDLTHGLNTAIWLAEDIGLAPLVQNANMTINETPGLGFFPATDDLAFKTP